MSPARKRRTGLLHVRHVEQLIGFSSFCLRGNLQFASLGGSGVFVAAQLDETGICRGQIVVEAIQTQVG